MGAILMNLPIYHVLAALWLFLWPGIAHQTQLPLLGTSGAASVKGPINSTPVQQTNVNASLSLQNSFTVTAFGSAPASGDMISAAFGLNCGGVSRAVNSVASTNTTWTMDVNLNSVTAPNDVALWHGVVTGSGGTTVTVGISGNCTGSGFAVLSEWNNILVSSPADGAGATNSLSSGTNPATGAYSTSVSGDLVIAAAVTIQSITVDPGAPYVAFSQPAATFHVSYIPGASSGAQSATWTTGTTGAWKTAIIGYKDP